MDVPVILSEIRGVQMYSIVCVEFTFDFTHAIAMITRMVTCHQSLGSSPVQLPDLMHVVSWLQQDCNQNQDQHVNV